MESVTAGFRGLVRFTDKFVPRPQISHVIFDFDGTLSLIRQGWLDVMVLMFQEMLPRSAGDTEESVRAILIDDVMTLNGKQTIYQMIQFGERVKERGGPSQDPVKLKHEYLRRLGERIGGRIEGLRNGTIGPDELLVHGARDLLDRLHQRRLQMYLLSGTDEPFVIREAELLDISHYFEGNIYGARDDYRNYSKKMVMDHILSQHRMTGERLLVFGDGYVEIGIASESNSLAIAVASDEANNGSGRMDEWKLDRLLGAGASVVIPDYRDAEVLLDRIFEI